MQITHKERACILAVQDLRSEFPPRLKEIASELGITPPTALALIRRLEGKGIVHEEKGSVVLTSKGKEVYKNIILAHRILETLLCRAGVSLDCACKEAQKFDYLIDPSYAKKLWNYLGKPKKCPHGKPIVSVSV
ncbi:MAG: metal-dependent transcriptional regulator [Candidatus Micrarchaeia archaeon]